MSVSYGPPMSDSDSDEYDGFYFGGTSDIKKTKPVLNNFHEQKNLSEILEDAIARDDAQKLTEELASNKININEPMGMGLTPLLTACKNGKLECVRCLLEKHGANVNKQLDSLTPLMMACDCTSRPSGVVDEIVQLLLKHGAVINIADKYGVTPFMLACKNGHVAVVRRLVKEVYFQAVDNQGNSSIFYSIENNRPEILKILVEAGANTDTPNRKGYTPAQVVEFFGFYDMLEILPKKKETYMVPPQYLTYNNVSDYIPRIFLKTECPEYFQEIYSTLSALNIGHLLQYFAKERISFLQFLSMNESALEAIGIKYPIDRMKVMKGLLQFHLYWRSKGSIANVSIIKGEDYYELLIMAANHLKQLAMAHGSILYVKNNLKNGKLGVLGKNQINALRRKIHEYRGALVALQKCDKYLVSFIPKINPLYIDYDEYVAERKRDKIRCYCKYTYIVIGVSVLICFKMRNSFFRF